MSNEQKEFYIEKRLKRRHGLVCPHCQTVLTQVNPAYNEEFECYLCELLFTPHELLQISWFGFLLPPRSQLFICLDYLLWLEQATQQTGIILTQHRLDRIRKP